MSYLSQFVSGSRSTTLIIGGKSVAGFAYDGAVNIPAAAKNVLSGAMTANTLKTIVSVTGKGRMPLFAFKSIDATSRTVRVKITVDGVVAFDYTSAAIATSGDVAVIAGYVGPSSPSFLLAFEGTPITWNGSLLIEVASSLTETDKIGLYYKYHLEQ